MRLPDDFLRRTGYRLPTEAEWEYACGAGATTAWSFGESDELLPRYGWFITNAAGRVHPVGRLKPNPFGLFDVHGNADEWCQTPHTPYRPAAPGDAVPDDDPGSPVNLEPQREVRGGHYREIGRSTRTAARAKLDPTVQYSFTGFRVARTVPR
jgi:formylglycine-generating enzyme required for sulfatase activity